MPNRLLVLALLFAPLPALAQGAASAPAAETEAAAPETPAERSARKARKAKKMMRAIESGEVAPGSDRGNINALIAMHAKAQKVPEHFVHYVVKRESNYNPRAVGSGGVLGLMQIKQATARGVGYSGPASGLLDAQTNLAYGIAYLAGAYRTAKGDEAQAYRYYARGYYYDAKRQGVTTQVAALDTPTIAPAAGGGLGGLIDKVFTKPSTARVVTASADPEALPVTSTATRTVAAAAAPVLRGTVPAEAPAEKGPAATVIDEASFKAIKTDEEMAAVLASLATLPLPPRRPAALRLAARRGGTSAVPKTALATGASGPVAETVSQ